MTSLQILALMVVLNVLIMSVGVYYANRRAKQMQGMNDGSPKMYLAAGEEWYCTSSGFSKDKILDQGFCNHGGPCPMDIRKKQ